MIYPERNNFGFCKAELIRSIFAAEIVLPVQQDNHPLKKCMSAPDENTPSPPKAEKEYRNTSRPNRGTAILIMLDGGTPGTCSDLSGMIRWRYVFLCVFDSFCIGRMGIQKRQKIFLSLFIFGFDFSFFLRRLCGVMFFLYL